MSKRLEREKKTIQIMIKMYCVDHHNSNADELCTECDVLWNYAQKRLFRCPFGEDKPTCAKCPVHCYKPEMRNQVREIMRYAGPRMIIKHPVLAFWHIIDGFKRTEKKS